MSDQSEAILQEIFETVIEEAEERMAAKQASVASEPTPSEDSDSKDKSKQENHTQWALGGNGRFMPVGSTAQKLTPGIYEPFATPGMWGVELINVASDGIYKLPDMPTEVVLEEVNKFWASEEKYRKHNLLYKRGILLFGPPGGGKTVCIKLLMNELVRRDGVVIVAQNIPLTIQVLKAMRRIEPKRNLIVVLEDIDEIIRYNGEAVVLSMLDGESNIDNILHLASTNYPERLGARIINRPSRFDRRMHVGMPNAAARRVYLEKTTNNGLTPEQLDQWVNDTVDLSIAHLRELVAAVYCLDQPYDDVIDRLRAMQVAVKPEDEFKRKGGLGFGSLSKSAFAIGSAN
ncbi:MAG TPA: AAA family ATPase [Anaerovoracaceae bacterium]|nr:AAA family ATPase [Anaerovoracaceae bacterium]